MNLPSLTVVRGVAALWVVLFHLQQFAGLLGVPFLFNLPVIRHGWAGVDLFFVLSGFILMLVHEADFRRFDWGRLGRFAGLRFFRVYPLATVVLLLILLLVVADRAFAETFAHSAIPQNLTLSAFVRTLFLANRWWLPADGDWNQPEWSLSVEIIGYAAFPLLAFLAGRLNNRWLVAALAVGSLFYPTADALGHGTTVANDLFWGALPRMAGGFAGGILMCRLHRLTPESFRRQQGWIGDLAMLALIVALVAPAPGRNATTLCFGAIIYGLASGRGMMVALLSTPFAVWLGRISFPLYLIHVMPLLWLGYNLTNYAHPGWAGLVAFGLYAAFAVSLAWALHLLVERPTHRFAREALAPQKATSVSRLAPNTPNG